MNLLILRKLYEGYEYFFIKHNDPRAEGYLFMQNPFPFFLLLGIYFWFVTKGGIEFMKNKEPYKLNNVMMVYNFFQVTVNTGLGIYATYWTYYQDYFSFKCQPIHYENDLRGHREFILAYCYFLLKVLDLLDTVFMVLRKRHSSISFLHLYHHMGVTIGTYYAARFLPGGHATLLGIVNAFVHSVMYFYYFITSFKPELKKSIWWKKHITQLQIVQFSYLMFHFGRPLILYPDCDYPKYFLWILVFQALFMNLLFADFYFKTYIKKNKNKNKIT